MEDMNNDTRTKSLENAAKSRVLILSALEKATEPLSKEQLWSIASKANKELSEKPFEQLLYGMHKNGLVQTVKANHPVRGVMINLYLAKDRPLPDTAITQKPKVVLDDAQLLQQCHEVLKSWKMADEMQAQIATMPNHPFRDQIRGMMSIAERQRDGLIKTIENRAR